MALNVAAARSEAERRKVWAFRYRLHVTEYGLPVGDVERTRGQLVDPLDSHSTSYALRDGTEVIGEIRLTALGDLPDPASVIAASALEHAIPAFGAGGVGVTGRFALDPSLPDGGALPGLLGAVHEAAAERGLRLLFTACSPHLVPFFEHLGFRRYTDTLVGEGGRFRVPMVFVLGDRDHLERIRSPLARAAARHAPDAEAAAWFARSFPQHATAPRPALLPPDVFFNLLAARIAGEPVHAVWLFRGLGPSDTDRLLARATVVRAQPGDRIVRQGERGDALYVLLAGVAEVRIAESPDFPIALLGAGDPFGEIGFLAARPRMADVVARTNCEFIALSGDFLRSLLTAEPVIAAKLLLNLAGVLAERLSDTTRDAALVG